MPLLLFIILDIVGSGGLALRNLYEFKIEGTPPFNLAVACCPILPSSWWPPEGYSFCIFMLTEDERPANPPTAAPLALCFVVRGYY